MTEIIRQSMKSYLKNTGKTPLKTLFSSCDGTGSMTVIPALTQNRKASPDGFGFGEMLRIGRYR